MWICLDQTGMFYRHYSLLFVMPFDLVLLSNMKWFTISKPFLTLTFFFIVLVKLQKACVGMWDPWAALRWIRRRRKDEVASFQANFIIFCCCPKYWTEMFLAIYKITKSKKTMKCSKIRRKISLLFNSFERLQHLV